MKAAFLVLTLPLFWLIGCNSESVEMEPNFLGGASCAPPCWQQIVPGESGVEEALNALSDPNVVKEGTLVNRTSNEYSFQLQTGGSGNIGVQNEIVRYIRLHVRQDFDITIEEVVTALGAPDSVYVQSNIPEEGGPTSYVIELLYPQKGVYARVLCNPPDGSSQVPGQGVTLDPRSQIQLLVFSAPPSLPYSYLQAQTDLASPWQGFAFYRAREHR